MRTTIDIDDDLLMLAKELAAREKRSAGKVISELAKKGLREQSATRKKRNGFEIIPAEQRVVTGQLVQKILEQGD